MRENLNTRQEKRAEQIIQVLGEFDESMMTMTMVQEEPNKNSSRKMRDLDVDEKMSVTSTANDSGLGDEIETWRLRAENAVYLKTQPPNLTEFILFF